VHVVELHHFCVQPLAYQQLIDDYRDDSSPALHLCWRLDLWKVADTFDYLKSAAGPRLEGRRGVSYVGRSGLLTPHISMTGSPKLRCNRFSALTACPR